MQPPSVTLELKRKILDDLSRQGLYEHLEAYEAGLTSRQHIWEQLSLHSRLVDVAEQLNFFRTKVKLLEKITTGWDHTKGLLVKAE